MDLTEHIILCNCIKGCTLGCEYCYARELIEVGPNWQDFSELKVSEHWVNHLTKYNNAIYMVTGFSDPSIWPHRLFQQVLDVCRDNPQNIYLFLTQNPYDIKGVAGSDNVWFGVTITKRKDKSRLDTLKRLPFQHKFVAFEPLFEDLGELNLNGIEWISIGRERGYNIGRPNTKSEWVSNIVYQFNGPVLMKGNIKEIMQNEFVQRVPNDFIPKLSESRTCTTYNLVTSVLK